MKKIMISALLASLFSANAFAAASACLLINVVNGDVSVTCDGKSVALNIPSSVQGSYSKRGSYAISIFINQGYKVVASNGGNTSAEYLLVKD